MAFNHRRYTAELLGSCFGYAVVLVATRKFLKVLEPEGVLRVLIAVAPILPTALIVFVILKHVRTMDELQRRIQTEAFVASALFVAVAAFTLGFLEDAGVPRPSLIWVLPAMIGGWGLAAAVIRKRYL